MLNLWKIIKYDLLYIVKLDLLRKNSFLAKKCLKTSQVLPQIRSFLDRPNDQLSSDPVDPERSESRLAVAFRCGTKRRPNRLPPNIPRSSVWHKPVSEIICFILFSLFVFKQIYCFFSNAYQTLF